MTKLFKLLMLIVATVFLMPPAFAEISKLNVSELVLLTGEDTELELRTTDVDPRGTLKSASFPDQIEPLITNDLAIAPFVGVWRGQWEGTLDSFFSIVEAHGNRVKVFHSWGTNAIAMEPGMRYVWGRIYENVILLPSDHASISLKKQDDGTLFGLYYSRAVHMPSRIILLRE